MMSVMRSFQRLSFKETFAGAIPAGLLRLIIDLKAVKWLLFLFGRKEPCVVFKFNLCFADDTKLFWPKKIEIKGLIFENV